MKKIKIKKKNTTSPKKRVQASTRRISKISRKREGRSRGSIIGDHLPSINHEFSANFDPTTVSRVPKRIPSSTSSIFSRRVVVVVVVIVVIVVAEVMAVDL